MKVLFGITCVASVLIFTACGGEQAVDESIEEIDIVSVGKGSIIINEYCYKAELTNEFGKKSDWIELHNTTSSDITLNSGEWTLSDNPDENDKFYIPEVIIAAGGFLVIYCDGKDTHSREIHANFKLKSEGETIGLYRNGELMDQQTHDSTGTEFQCMCRETDNGVWQYSNDATPGLSNN